MSPTYLWNQDFFKWAEKQPDNSIDTIITDPPYTSFRNKKVGEEKLSDKSFDIKKFCETCLRILKPEGIFISFCSIHLLKDYFFYFNNKLRFRCEQIWDKRPTRSWISYSLPLRHIEYIVYFGEGKLDFRKKSVDSIGKAYKRSQFGGELRNTKKNTKKYSQSQYQQILEGFNVPEKKSQKFIRSEEFLLQKKNNLKDKSILQNLNHPTRKDPAFSSYFKEIIVNPGKVLDPCCGTGALICSFEDAIGIDIREWQPVDPPKEKKRQFKIDSFIT